jgi:hypothetical protein
MYLAIFLVALVSIAWAPQRVDADAP